MSSIETDVCIIGSGAAGITLALELAARGIRSVLVTGGEKHETGLNRKLYEGSVDPPGSHEPIGSQRVRAYGGGTLRWGGRCIPFDPIDFEPRPHLGLPGWPIKAEEVDRFREKAAEYCVLGGARFDYPSSSKFPHGFEQVISVAKVERWSPPVNFASRYGKELEASEQIRVLRDWHLVDLQPDMGKSAIGAAIARDRNGGEVKIHAKRVVIATGGIETPRILLNLQERHPAVFGHISRHLGRNYMGHLMGQFGTLEFADKSAICLFDFFREGPAYVRRRFWLQPDVQRRKDLLNVIGFPFRPDVGDASHRDPALSLMCLFQERAAMVRRKDFHAHLRNIFVCNPVLVLRALAQVIKRFAPFETRLPFILPVRYAPKLALWIQAEHAPNERSGVTLGDGVDEFGWRQAVVHVAFDEVDRRTFTGFLHELRDALRISGTGDLHFDEAELDRYLNGLTQSYSSGSHHIGTARMSDDPAEGVVDADGRVHGIPNLYLCGSATFPTSGHANPTFLIVQLAIRLAEHLGSEFRGSRSSGAGNARNSPI